ARRGRLRSRAVTTTVVATVVAAPVLALWAAYRGGPMGEGQGAASVSVPDSLGGSPGEGAYDHPYGYEEEAAAEPAPPTGRPAVQRLSEVSVAVLGTGPGRLTVEAQPGGTATHITLTASGGELVGWSMSADAPWLRLSQPGGVLRPGQTVTVVVTVDRAREPARAWRARVAVAPGGSVVTLEGKGGAPS
ncbi:BACON domain-containing protein, partial [Streptomyces alboverticillatus]